MRKNLNPDGKWWICEEHYPRSPYAKWNVRLSNFYDSIDELKTLIKGYKLEVRGCPYAAFVITNEPCYVSKSKSTRLFKKEYFKG